MEGLSPLRECQTLAVSSLRKASEQSGEASGKQLSATAEASDPIAGSSPQSQYFTYKTGYLPSGLSKCLIPAIEQQTGTQMVTRELGTAVKVLTAMLPGMIVELRRGKAIEGSELCGLFCGSSEDF